MQTWNIERGHIFAKLYRVCRRGDIKRLDDSVLNDGSVCGRASVEVEVTTGHDGILKGDGGRSSWILERSDNASTDYKFFRWKVARRRRYYVDSHCPDKYYDVQLTNMSLGEPLSLFMLKQSRSITLCRFDWTFTVYCVGVNR